MSTMAVSVTAGAIKVDNATIPLPPNSIVVVTGPNNSGKSSFLNDVTQKFRHYGQQTFKGLIVQDVETCYSGESSDLLEFLNEQGLFDQEEQRYGFGYGKYYKKETLTKAWDGAALPWIVAELFVAALDPRVRLGTHRYYGQRNRGGPLDALWDNEVEEIRISQIFNRAFGTDLILDRARGEGEFRIGDRKRLPPHKKRFSKEFRKLLDSFEEVDDQGDGLRSFASIALDLLTARKVSRSSTSRNFSYIRRKFGN